MAGQHLMAVGIKPGKTVDVIPDLFAFRMENMAAVAVDLDPRLPVAFAVAVSPDMPTPVDHKDMLVKLVCDPLSDDGAEESGADKQIFSSL